MEHFALIDGAMAFDVLGASKIFANPKTPWLAALSPHDDLRLAGPLLIAHTSLVKDSAEWAELIRVVNAFPHRLHVSRLDSELSLEALAEHLRRFAHFRDSAGDSYALRIADGRVLAYLPDVLTAEQWDAMTAPVASWLIQDRKGGERELKLNEQRLGRKGEAEPLHLTEAQIEQLMQAGDPDALLAHIEWAPSFRDEKYTQERYDTACQCVREWRSSGGINRVVLAAFLRSVFRKGTAVRHNPAQMRSLLDQAGASAR